MRLLTEMRRSAGVNGRMREWADKSSINQGGNAGFPVPFAGWRLGVFFIGYEISIQ